VANSGTDSVGVLLGYGDGNFSIINIYSTGIGSTPQSVIVGDFNDDDQMDIAVANYGTNSVGVLLGYGDGTFGNQITSSAGSASFVVWIASGDFNKDNQLDIATANYGTDSVGFLLGYGNGTFANIMTYSTGGGSTPLCISVGDFNNDSILDIAAANYGTNTIVVLFGFGDGSFLLGTPYSTGIGSQPYALATGDFNHDSRLDVAVANSFTNNIGVFLGNGSQPFAGVTTYTTGDGSQPHSVAVGDLNNDGWSDVVVANYGTNNLGILLGYSHGVFGTMITYSTGIGSAPYSVAIADFNNDTHLDIVVTNSETDNIAILLGYGNGTFAIGVAYSTGVHSRPYTVAIGDLNNDKVSDIVIANSGTNNIFLLYGYGNGTFGNETSYPLGDGYLPYSVAVTDLNQDNWMDIVIACYGTDHIETLIKMC
jgi:streptogramin lyase